nr:hypothetical protein [Tanacetum cinerariifolium]
LKRILGYYPEVLGKCCHRRRDTGNTDENHRGKEFIDEFGNKILPSVNKTRGFFLKPPAGCPCERERKKHKLDCRIWHILVFDGGSYFVEPTDVIMRIVLF